MIAIPFDLQRVRSQGGLGGVDPWLLGAAVAIIALGFVMVASSSLGMAERATGDAFYFVKRQGIFLLLGLAVAWVALQSPLASWERASTALLFLALVLLAVVLMPGIGRTVNGATRWLPFGPFNVQVSEPAKLFLFIYLAGYLVRRTEEVRTQAAGFLKPMGIMVVATLLLLIEPDFGASVVLLATALGMMFLGGARLWQFGLLLSVIVGSMGILAVASPYRLQRLTAFLNPWADPYNSGFQLTQALIAIGRGEWGGVGLGGGVQKLFYLPEAHTDFLFAVLAEELGLMGVATVIALFGILVWRAFAVAAQAQRVGLPFGTHLAHGIGIWLGLQAFINMGVNMGILPTKGLTLPMMSYGGSSLVVMCLAVALLLRVGIEVAQPVAKGAPAAKGTVKSAPKSAPKRATRSVTPPPARPSGGTRTPSRRTPAGRVAR